jgi:hypothetical protein
MPMMMAVAMGGLWNLVHSSVQQMEPYYQLSRPGGCRAEGTLTSDYAACWIYGVPLKAGAQAQWAVALSSFITVLTSSVLPTVHSTIWQIDWPAGHGQRPQYGVARIHKAAMYGAISVSLLAVILGCVLMVILARRKSGMISGTGGLAGLASLICDSPDVLKIFRRLHPCATLNMISTSLEGKQFFLRYVTVRRPNGDSEVAYQITTNDLASETPRKTPKELPLSEAHPIALRGWLLLAVELLLMAPVIAIIFATTDKVKWPPSILKALLTFYITVVNSYHNMVDQALRVIQPYATLKPPRVRCRQSKAAIKRAQRHSVAALLQDYTHLSPPALFVASFNSAYILLSSLINLVFVNWATIVFPTLFEAIWELWASGMLGDADPVSYLDIANSSYDYFGPPALGQCVSIQMMISTVIGLYTFFHMLVVIVKRRWPFMPRQPNSMASNMAYLAGSQQLLEIVRGTSLMTTKERERRIMESEDLAFQYGWFMAMGKVRLGVEVAPVLEAYIFDMKRPNSVNVV